MWEYNRATFAQTICFVQDDENCLVLVVEGEESRGVNDETGYRVW